MDTASPPKPARQASDAEGAINHRTIVGRQRRARTEARIIKAALHVFAESGHEAPVIDDFIKAAGIARGTFYNYFRSTEELLHATTTWLTDDLVESIEKELRPIKDPMLRHATGLRLWMRKAENDPAWCRFVSGGWYDEGYARVAPLRDIRAGLEAGAFDCGSAEAGFDLAMGTMRQAMLRLATSDDFRGRNYADEIARLILRGLGAEPSRIIEVMAHPVPEMRRPPQTIR